MSDNQTVAPLNLADLQLSGVGSVDGGEADALAAYTPAGTATVSTVTVPGRSCCACTGCGNGNCRCGTSCSCGGFCH